MAINRQFKKRINVKRKKHGKSILQNKNGVCYLCYKLHRDFDWKQTEEHHAFFGPLRTISEREGLKVYLCRDHHRTGPEAVHMNHEICRMVQRDAQKKWEETHTRAQWMELIGRNYLTEKGEQ